MRLSRTLRRLAAAVYYEIVSVDQLLPFVQSCISQPNLADNARELYVSGKNGHFHPDRSLFDPEGASSHDSFRSRMLSHSIKDGVRTGPSEVFVAMTAVILCTKLEKIFVDQSAMVHWVLQKSLLEDCAAPFRSNNPTPSHIPLSNLRTFAMQIPPRDNQTPPLEIDWWDDDSWLQLLSNLPMITSLEIAGYNLPLWYGEGSKSNLRSLTIVDLPVNHDGTVILSILKGCPALECLDLTVPPRQDGDYDYIETWSGIGHIVSRHGAPLRKFRYDNILNQTLGLLNVSALRNLRYLAVSVDALMELDAVYENDGVFNGN